MLKSEMLTWFRGEPDGTSSSYRPIFYAVMMLASLLIAVIPLISNNSYSNLYYSDALYILNAAYLIYNGYVAHIDFVWQFGGYEASLAALAMHIFGVSARALDQAIAFGYVISVVLLVMVSYNRTKPLTFSLLLFLITASALTRYPFEQGYAVASVQSYAMYYNRICWCLTIVIFTPLFVSRDPLRYVEIIAVGISCYLIVMTKITFALTFPLALALLFHRNGWRGIATWGIAIIAMIALVWAFTGFSPGGYARIVPDMLSVTNSLMAAKFGAISKLINVILYNIGYVILILMLSTVVFYRRADIKGDIHVIVSALFLAILSAGVTVSTGTFYALSATTPILAFFFVIFLDIIADKEFGGRNIAMVSLATLVFMFSGPYLANYVLGMVKQVTRGDQSIFSSGPLAGLIIDQPDDNKSPSFASIEKANAYIAARSRLEGGVAWMQDYEWQYLIKDGVDLIERMPDGKRLRIAAFYPAIFPFTTVSAPVTSFALMPTSSPDDPVQAEVSSGVDAVAVLRADPHNPIYGRYSRSLSRDFRVIERSAFWDLYRRIGR